MIAFLDGIISAPIYVTVFITGAVCLYIFTCVTHTRVMENPYSKVFAYIFGVVGLVVVSLSAFLGILVGLSTEGVTPKHFSYLKDSPWVVTILTSLLMIHLGTGVLVKIRKVAVWNKFKESGEETEIRLDFYDKAYASLVYTGAIYTALVGLRIILFEL